MTLVLAASGALALSGAALAASPNPPPSPSPRVVAYSIVDLGELGYFGGAGSVTAINDNGVATGTVIQNGSFFARTWPGGTLPLSTYHTASQGLAINDAGTVAGAALGCPNGCPNGTLWSEGALWQGGALQVPSPLIQATGINDSGLVVGYDSVNDLGTRAVAWRNGSLLTFAPLAQIQNPWVAEASAVNDSGTVVGNSLLAEPGVEHAFVAQVLRTGVGPTVDLGALPAPFKESNAFGINDRGVIAGASSVAWGNSTCHAVMWVNRKIVDLGALAPATWGPSAALGINEAGDVVGFAGLDNAVDGDPYGASAGMRAVLWKNGAAIDLDDLIAPGWSLAVAHDVNNRGEIAGSGFKTGDPVPHGFVLVPVTRISSFTVSPSRVTGGKTAAATITLTRPAPPGGETILVTGPSPASAPAQVTIARGKSTATFSVTTSIVKRTTAVTVTATLDGRPSKATLTVASRS